MAEAATVLWVVDVCAPVLGGWAHLGRADTLAVLNVPMGTFCALLRQTDALALLTVVN